MGATIVLGSRGDITLATYRLVIWWVGLYVSMSLLHMQDCAGNDVNVNFRDEQCKSHGTKWRALDEGTLAIEMFQHFFFMR